MSIVKKSLRSVKTVAVEVGRQLVRGSGSPLYKVQRGQGVTRVAERHFGRALWTLTLHQRGDGTGWWDLQEKEGTRGDTPHIYHDGRVVYDRPEALPQAVKDWTASVLRRSLKVNLGEPSGSGSPKRRSHSPEFKPEITSVNIHGRRWFNRGPGNTYHSAEIYVNGRLVHKLSSYGGGSMYEQNATKWLIQNGYIKAEQHKHGGFPSLWRLAEEGGFHHTSSVVDVPRKKDL